MRAAHALPQTSMGPEGRSNEYRALRQALLGAAEHAPRPEGAGRCRWRRCGCAWHSAMSRRKHPISSIGESSSERPPWQLSPRPAPFPPTVYGAARSWLRGPGGGIPPQTAGIALWVPCREQPGIRRPVPECIPGYSDGTLAPTSVVTGSFWTSSPLGRGPGPPLRSRAGKLAKQVAFWACYREGVGDGNTFSALLRVAA
jgi:hypothetical protein